MIVSCTKKTVLRLMHPVYHKFRNIYLNAGSLSLIRILHSNPWLYNEFEFSMHDIFIELKILRICFKGYEKNKEAVSKTTFIKDKYLNKFLVVENLKITNGIDRMINPCPAA